MSAVRMPGGLGRARALVVGLVLAATAAGCAASGTPLPARPSTAVLPAGSPLLSRTLADGDAWLRHYLMRGDHDAALDVLRHSAARPRDRLLRALQEGVVFHHAGRYAESNRVFEWAEREADRRYTRSVRRGLGSLLINDRVLAYMPSAGELAIVPYYRMLNYLAMGRVESAAVEARKASAYLTRLDERETRDACAGFGLVQYLAGQVYTAAGELNDALVSLRRAERSFRACDASGGAAPPGLAADLLQAALALGVSEVADSVAARYDLTAEPLAAGEADLIVLIEHGFAAHRAQQDLLVPILSSEAEGVDGDGSAAAAAGQVTARLASALLSGQGMHRLWDEPAWNPVLDTPDGSPWRAGSADLAYVLRLAWPVMRLEASRPTTTRLIVDDAVVEAPALEDVSARLVRDLESRRNAILARMVARGLVKYAISREVEEQTEKKGGELIGALVGLVTNTAANLLEQADTRTWSLLPDQIAMARVRVPAGAHRVRIEVLDRGGMVSRIVELGTVEVRAGARVFLSQRVWGAEPGDRERLIRLGAEVYGRSEVPRGVANHHSRDSRKPPAIPAPSPAPTGAAPRLPVGVPPGTRE